MEYRKENFQLLQWESGLRT
nr:unnamed protein product [Callosobruchus analis]